ncbi:MAG: cadmium-translocating P-type ATPase [Planctomycetes bacterium]|nr:cadmium-translocating P-type ATPase [Planctomycetota bacterium]
MTSCTPQTAACGCPLHDSAEDRQRLTIIRLILTFLGGALIINSFIAEWIFTADPQRASFSAMIGAILLGGPLIWKSIKDLMLGHFRMTELASLAILASFTSGLYTEAGLVAFFLQLGQLIESRTALGAQASIEGLIRLTPTTAHLVSDGAEHDVEVISLKKGDIIRVRPGENIPADGIITSGATSINEASVTGESLPVDKGPDEIVFAGTENYTGAIDIKVTTVGEDTTLGKVRHLIMEAERTRLPVMQIIDKYVHWYTPVILMLSAIILFFSGEPSYAIAALVVSCPCALVMATPTAMVAGLTSAARLGILIKNVAHLEAAGEITAVVCDKTGTLTTGELAVSRLSPLEGIEPAQLLYTAASAERHSNHPVARALLRVAQEARLELGEPTEFIEAGGKGITATLDGKKYAIGRESFLKEQKVDFSKLSEPELKESEGFSTIYVAENGVCLGWIGLEDHTRPEARQATDELREAGIRHITMLTGDRWGVAKRVAGELGCDEVVAECLPAQKLELVEEMKKNHLSVAVVGDGVNDAPALAAGDLGIAMGAAGSDIAVNSASIALMSNDLRRLPFLVRLSRLVRKVVYQNLVFGILFIVIGITLSAYGKITPIMAAVLHCLGSVPVIFNSARIVRYGEELS